MLRSMASLWNTTWAPGEEMIVDTGNVAGFEPGVSIDIRQVAGIKNKLLGGEGILQYGTDRAGKDLAADYAGFRSS